MAMNKISTSLRVLGLSLLAPFCASAGIVIWESAINISEDSDVLNTGTLVRAINFDSTTGPSVIDGVSFEHFSVPGSTTTANTWSTGEPLAGDLTINGGATSIAYSGVFGIPSGLSAAYGDFASRAIFGAADSTFDLTIQNLTVGYTYQLQFWASDARVGTPNDRGTTFTAGNTGTALQNPSGSLDGAGQFIVGSFTADSTTQVITVGSTSSAGAVLTGYQLRLTAVPEPSAYPAIAGFMALSLALLRRKRPSA